ncbi:MAG: hypothetical protein M1837_002830 [Sclerophora amabilis]|nr:MAG: hypothetical protein M1837_002830 [Sclerophora amabilis]
MFAKSIEIGAVLAVFAAAVSASCAYGTSLHPRQEQPPAAKYGYGAVDGPLLWYGLNKTANEECSRGNNQSPIVIDSTTKVSPASEISLEIPDYPDGAEFENLGTTVEVIVNGTLKISGKEYKLAQFHFHTPGEHRINDEFYPMEVHFVHQAEDNSRAVVGFMVELCNGSAEPFLGDVLASVQEIKDSGATTQTKPLSFKTLTESFNKTPTWRYDGSLTTPPCSEEVQWIVSQKILYLDVVTWLAAKKVVKFNARYTQNSPGNDNLLEISARDLAE